jgi:preprotein translocase subunit SecD
VTLTVGVITSVFAALVFTRLHVPDLSRHATVASLSI